MIVGLVAGGGVLAIVVTLALVFLLFRKGHGDNRAAGADGSNPGQQVADDGAAYGGQAVLPVMRGKFKGQYTDLPVTTQASYPPVSGN